MAKWYIAPDGRWRTIMFKCNMFPTLDTYIKALTHEEQVVPMRGTNIKPIHLRSRKYMEIRRLENDDVVYLDTSWGMADDPHTGFIVKWKPNGEIHINAPMYNCVYEQLTSLLGVQFCREKNHLWVCLDNQWLALHSRHSKEVTVLKWVKNHDCPQYKRDYKLQYVNPPTLTQKAIDRGVAKAVRAKYKRVYDYIKGMVKLRDDGKYPITEFIEAFDFTVDDEQTYRQGAYWTVQRLLPKISLDFPLSQQDDIVEMISLANEGDLDMSRKLWLTCAYANGYRYGWQSDDVICSPNQVVKAFDNFILRLHREEVFYDKEVPTGKTPSTANDKFFR